MSDSEELESDQELEATQAVDSESLNSEDSYDETSFAHINGSSQLRKGKARASQDDTTDEANSEPEPELLSSPPTKRKRTGASSESLGSDEDEASEAESSSRRLSKRRKEGSDDAASEDIGSEESDASEEDEEIQGSSRTNGVRFADQESDNQPSEPESSVNSLGSGSDDGTPTSLSGSVQSKGPAMLGPAAAKPLLGTSSLTNNDDELASGSDDEY